ncbi:basigin-like [Babylonia areolata]|uniref:basigin-like n=1 Tax=Babylonia areolata TaxID=304850 RepID=UPI003FD6B7BB
MWLNISLLTLCLIYFAHAQSVQIEPFQSVFSVVEGSSLQVNCTSTSSVTWSAEPPQAMPDNAVKGSVHNGDNNINTLILTNVNKSNEGTFRCMNPTANDQMAFQLKVFNVSTHSPTFEYKVDTTLECKVNDASGLTFTYSWKKGDTPVEDIAVEGKQAFISHSNGTLEIIHPARRFAGLYTCTAEYKVDQETHAINIDVPYYATPKVLPFDKSKNLVQEEVLVVKCQVLGYPKPMISWMKGNTIIQPVGDKSHYKLAPADTYDGKSIDNAQLSINKVDFDDAGEYKCVARQRRWPAFNSTQVILVRVKDKLAALWPFLGIVAEVVILCTIIFVYEKKRNKDAMMEDEEEDQNGATHDKKSDSVRHRGNTNNPRA